MTWNLCQYLQLRHCTRDVPINRILIARVIRSAVADMPSVLIMAQTFCEPISLYGKYEY